MKVILNLIVLVVLFSTVKVQAQKYNPPFFVFEDGLWNARSDAPSYWANLVKDVGFDGIELIGLDKVNGMLPEIKKNDLQLFTLYIQIDIDKEEAYDKRLKGYIKQLKNTGLHLWVHVHSEDYEISDPAGDEKCIKIISELADFAKDYGTRIAFYPHSNFWVEKVGDGVRLAKKINKENVGVVFNLCHFLKADNPDMLEETLQQAQPYLFLVSINGAEDGPGTNKMGWDKLIQPLGKGTYDVLKVLRLLKEMAYTKPIGLQCYNLKGQPEDFLKMSMVTWENYMHELNR